MSDATLAPRAAALLSRLDAWAAQGTARALVIKVVVTVAGPPSWRGRHARPPAPVWW